MTKLIIATLITCFTNCLAGYAQINDPADSILYYLKLIDGSKSVDSAHIDQTINLINHNKKEVLLENTAINNELQRIKTISDPKKYYELEGDFFMSHFYLDTPPNAALIKYGKNYIEQNKNNHPGNYATSAYLSLLRELRVPYRNSNQIYEGIVYYNSLSKEFLNRNDSGAVSICYNVLAGFYSRLAITEKAEYYMLKSIDYLDDRQISPEELQMEFVLGKAGKTNRYSVLGKYKIDAGDVIEGEKYLSKAITEFKQLKNPLLFIDGPFIFFQMARCKSILNSDSSYYYFDEGLHYMKLMQTVTWNYAFYYMLKGADFLNKNVLDSAMYFVGKSKTLKDSAHLQMLSPWGELMPNYYYASIRMKQNNPRAAIELLLEEITVLKENNVRTQLIMELKLLAEAYASAGKQKESLNTLRQLIALKEKMDKESNDAKSISFDIEKKMQQTEISLTALKARDENNRKTRYYLYGISALLALFAVTLAVAIFNKQKSNTRLIEKNNEITVTLEKLKNTQSQLIQSEKMASLGELTAGIAHEIQNPLNFVNNFSDVNTELIEELKSELKDGKIEQVFAIANDIKENEEKINRHGKRADAIVRGMLQHSRSGAGQREATDLNNLADEYLRLAYNGWLAKDKLFNATLKTDFDEKIGRINIIPQDIGRVLLNLYNNAFYAVNEKKRTQTDRYDPLVSVTTKKIGNKVEIRVKDNGNGIPRNIIDKIFQPFYTTKPTGQGTGLGLSLSYDIVKAHGGELKVETKEDEARPDDRFGRGSEFIIYLPLNAS